MPHIKEEQLSAYLDRQLPARESGPVEAHLRECGDCRVLLEEMREVNRLFQNAERLEPSPFLWTRIAAGFEQERSPKRWWAVSALAGMRRFGLNPGIAAAAFGILMFVGIAIFKQPDIDPAALAEIDKARQSMAAKNPDTYNPFDSGPPADFDANPFRGIRLSGRINSAPPKN